MESLGHELVLVCHQCEHLEHRPGPCPLCLHYQDEAIPLSYECCGRPAPEKWHERLIICPRFLLPVLVVGLIIIVAVLANAG